MGSLSVTWDEHYRGAVPAADPRRVVRRWPPIPRRSRRWSTTRPRRSSSSRCRAKAACGRFPPRWSQAIEEACARTGALLIADEVQSGAGRTGQFLDRRRWASRRISIALGKALGGGMPVGAAMVSAEGRRDDFAGDHGTTYGGNLLACRAALVFLDELERRPAGARADGVRPSVRRPARAAVAACRSSRTSGALGLIAGLDFAKDPTAVVAAALERGLLINRTATTVIRLLPPYIVTEAGHRRSARVAWMPRSPRSELSSADLNSSLEEASVD